MALRPGWRAQAPAHPAEIGQAAIGRCGSTRCQQIRVGRIVILKAAMAAQLPSISRYGAHLEAAAGWLLRSMRPSGGSSAYYAPLLGWSRSYPETTGYLIPTLLRLREQLASPDAEAAALEAGSWLLSLQTREGCWFGGLHPPRGRRQPSVFNTGQILLGLCALHCWTGEAKWLEAAARGASWLAAGVDAKGEWSGGHYRSGFQPSYYTRVAWPMLEVWRCNGDNAVREAAERALTNVLGRRRSTGAFAGWGFVPDRPAFTHTIAYTLRGLLESARLLDDWPRYGAPTEEALEILRRRAELAGGRLPGAFDDNWRADRRFVCLTGCAQVALCLLIAEARTPDLRLVNAISKLVDAVCARQRLTGPDGIRGAVPGSAPFWGRYMRLRYPNWAAKFHADALDRLIGRLERELR